MKYESGGTKDRKDRKRKRERFNEYGGLSMVDKRMERSACCSF